MATKWEYAVTEADSLKAADDLLREWVRAGWELVNGSTAMYPITQLDGPRKLTVWYSRYTLFLRRAIGPNH